MKALAAASIGIALMAGVAQPKNIRSLELYVADTEGGKAALFVSPSRETLLIDSGNPGGRDTDRIVAMLNDGGFKPRRNTPLSNRASHSDRGD
jgi:hypothetical protein